LSGWKSWEIGEVVEAGEFQSFVQDQTVQKYADAAARGSALGTAVAEGMVSYLDDSNQVEVYDGSAWVSVGQDLTTGTQGFTALSNGTAGLTYQPVSHNYIINGAFDVWQRGTSGFTTNGAFTADRYEIVLTGETVAVSQQTFSPADITAVGFGEASFFARYQVTTSANAANNALYRTKIEDVRNLAGQTVTFSYFAKADAAKSVAIELTQNFGSGGSSSVNTFVAKQAITTSWARYSHTVTVPSIAGKTVGAGSFIDLRFWLSAGSNFNARTDSLGQQSITFDTFGWQLEAGSVATPFKRHAPSLQGELAACQRYFERVTGGRYLVSGADDSWQSTIPLAAEKRITPSITTTATDANYGTVWRFGKAGKLNLTKTGTGTITFTGTSSKHIIFAFVNATFNDVANSLNDIEGLTFDANAEL
jgi:hypothetical protein